MMKTVSIFIICRFQIQVYVLIGKKVVILAFLNLKQKLSQREKLLIL